MRVLHLYSGNLFGGVETLLLRYQQLRSLAPALAPSFALCFDGLLAEKLRVAGADLTLLSSKGVRFSRPWTVLKARRGLGRLAPHAPDVVVCHEGWSFTLAAPVVRRAKVKLAIFYHGQAGNPWLEAAVKRHPPELALCCSKIVARHVAALVPRSVLKVCYAPVPPPDASHALRREEVRRMLGVDGKARVVLHIGRMTPLKGHLELIAAAAALKDPTLRLWFAGAPRTPEEERYRGMLTSECERLGITSNVTFLGHSDRVHDLYAAADVYCQPNRGPESFGLTFIEALYAGLEIITPDFGGATEILSEEASGARYGKLIEPGNQQALVEALRDAKHPEHTDKLKKRALSLCEPRAAMHQLEASLHG